MASIKKKNRRSNWFSKKPRQKRFMCGPFHLSIVDLREGKALSQPLIISVPAVCGKSVLRNRLKRMLREKFSSSFLKKLKTMKVMQGEALWIRVDRRYRLEKRELTLRKLDKQFEALR